MKTELNGGSHMSEEKEFNRSIITPNSAPHTSPHVNHMRENLGTKLYQQIKLYKKLLKSKTCTDQIRHDAEEAYNFIIKVAKQDVINLQNVQFEIIKISYALRNIEAQYILDSIILNNVHKLILKQAELNRKVQCGVKLQSIELLKSSVENDFEETVIEALKKGYYKQVVELLLGFNGVINASKAEKLYSIAQEVTKIHSYLSEEILAFLKLRLFSENARPSYIDYTSLKNNELLEDLPKIKQFDIDIMALTVLLEDVIKFKSYLWESKLRLNFQNMIVNEIDGLLNLVTQGKGEGDHLQYLKR